MRHCERTPGKNELYPNSPYRNESYFAPYGYDQLTNVSILIKKYFCEVNIKCTTFCVLFECGNTNL